MTQLLVILLVLFVSGALIAAMGDRLGTYIGKKRLSGFGLRPKHTAMLYTMLFGGLIAVLTVLAVLAISTDFQRALIHGHDLIKNNSDLQGRLNSRQHQLSRIQDRLTAVTSQEAAEEQRETEAGALQAIAEKNLGLSKQALAHTQLMLDHRQQLLTKQEALLKSSLSALEQAKEGLRLAQSNLSLTRQGLFDERDSLSRATATVKAQEHRVKELEQRSLSLASNIQILIGQNQTLVQEHQQLVQQPIVFSKGQEIDRTVMSTNQTYSNIRNQVVAFLEQLSQDALLLHGKAGKNGRAVIMLPYNPSDVDDQETYEPDNLTEDLTIDNLAHGIQDAENQADSVVLVARAHINSFSGEQTEAKIVMYPNFLVFQKGTLIGSTTIDGSQPEDPIFKSLGLFLLDNVGPVATQRGMIPRRERDGELTVGAPTDSPQTLALVKHIEVIGPGAIVSVYAASDTYRNGPLYIKMSASPPPPTAPPVAVPPSTPEPPVVKQARRAIER